MLTAAEYAAKIGRTPRCVLRWCTSGLLPGAVKSRIGKRTMYLIPEDVTVPQIRPGRPPGQFNSDKPTHPTGKNYTQKEMCDFIKLNCNRMTYGQISGELGISAAEVRRIYDHLHEAYGV